jgi:hypothetical protein
LLFAIDTAWDVIDLYNDASDCLGDSDSMACYMAAAGVAFVAMGALEGPSNNVARRAAKAADVGDAAEDVARRVDDVDDLVIDSYGKLKRNQDIPGQAHHLNQAAAYRDVILHSRGASVKLEGNIFTDPGTPHLRAHESMETFWDSYRGTEFVPTNLEYTKALQQSLRAAGLPESQVRQAVRVAIRERIAYGLLGGLEVPRVPGPIRNLAR